MSHTDPAHWSERLRDTLERYDEPLLRQVADKLYKPRSQWPREELIERSVATMGNAAVIDRRLQALEPSSRRLLALIGHSRQPRWKVGHLLEMLHVLEQSADTRPVLALLDAGLLYPELPAHITRLKQFEAWLGLGSPGGPVVFAHPQVTERVRGEDLGLPECPGIGAATGAIHEADGLEWLLRLAVVWQQVAAAPLRRTQQGDFFKRDLDRLREDSILTSPPADSVADLPDPGLLTVELAVAQGLLTEVDGELRALNPPPAWDRGLRAVLEELWSSLPMVEAWDPHDGWRGHSSAGNPYPSAQLLALLLLTRLPRDAWADPKAIEAWILSRHPFWNTSTTPEATPRRRVAASLTPFLLGLAFQMRMLQAAKDAQGSWLVRLSSEGRWLLGLAEPPSPLAAFPQTLMVQPNLEIIAYRQGLTPALIVRLGQIAAWKNLGSACTLQLQPDTVYRALESGQTFETIRQTLEQHGMRPTPTAVLDSLRTWSNKRERLGVYPSATLFEFATADDLSEALARGLPGTRLSDRLAVVANESAVDFRHFRLTGTRDYGLQPEKCVEIDADGVTLNIDLTRSDLMLETEIQRFAEASDRSAMNGRRQYRLTPESLAAARDRGLTSSYLDEWFQQRSGRPLTAAARLLLNGPQLSPLELRPQLVLHVSAEDIADGLLQWPGTRALIEGRLGPTALLIAEENAAELRKRLAAIGLTFKSEIGLT